MINIAACQVPEIREAPGEALAWIEDYAEKAVASEVSLLCFPECFLHGYLLEEKSARHYALDLSSQAFDDVLDRLRQISLVLVFGLIEIDRGCLFNTAVVVQGGKLVGSYRKCHLLGGESIFKPGSGYPVFEAGGVKFGINICYDTNFSETAAALADQGARLIVCPSNNMMSREKSEKLKYLHNKVRSERARESGLWLLSSDVTGERDNRICYGPTALINPDGNVVSQLPLQQVGMLIGSVN